MIKSLHQIIYVLASSAWPFVFPVDCVAAKFRSLPPARSFELNRLWKKFCKTSCCVCAPPVGLVAEEGLVDVGTRVDGGIFVDALSPASPVGLPGGRFANLRGSTAGLAVFVGVMDEFSISLSTRSTLGILKLLLPRGPTIPAGAPVVRSVGFRNEARGSLSAFFEFSS